MEKKDYPEIGQVLVFKGAQKPEDSRMEAHFKNFKVGKRYEVSGIIHVGYDMDDMHAYSSMAVIFRDETFGCHLDIVWEYFVPQSEWREGLLSKIIGRIAR